jgi:hypothetical protein
MAHKKGLLQWLLCLKHSRRQNKFLPNYLFKAFDDVVANDRESIL